MDKLNKDQEKELDQWLNSDEFEQVFMQKEASDQMDLRFYNMLSKQKNPVKQQSILTWFYRLAIPAMAVVVAFFVGQNLTSSDTIENTTDFATELLQSEDVGKKINLVSTTKIEDETDQKIIDALLFTLNNDESVNVRLACINTLYDYAYLPKVRSGLIQAVSNQQSPVVLANLAQAINASGKKLSKEEFMDLINKDLPPPIKSTIDASLIKI